VGVKNSEIEFLQFLEEMNLTLGKEIKVEKELTFDKSRTVLMNKKELTLSEQVCKNIIIKIK
jgi:DtxR family Mn-dependent transcriptional regulator